MVLECGNLLDEFFKKINHSTFLTNHESIFNLVQYLKGVYFIIFYK